MNNLLWYCSLAVIGLLSAAFAIYKKKNIIEVSTFIVFYIFATSITWIGEFVALGLFNGYAYKPGVFTDPWAENLLGHLILNSTFWPGAAIIIVAYSLRYRWISLITVLFILIEYLFLSLKIYEQHWWRYYMTATAIFIYLAGIKKWFVKMNQKRYGWPRAITFYFVGFVILHLPAPLLLLFGKQYYNVDLVANRYLSSTIFILIYQLIECVIWTFFVLSTNKLFWKLVPLAISFLGQSVLTKMNILIFQNGGNLFYTMIFYAISFTAFILLERYTLKPTQPICTKKL